MAAAFFEKVAHGRFHFPNQDHTLGALLCDYLDRDSRVAAVGHIVRDKVLQLQIDAADPDLCLQEAARRLQHDLQILRRNVVAANNL